nr:hypothetical protein [Actinomadura sp. HBU206391]
MNQLLAEERVGQVTPTALQPLEADPFGDGASVGLEEPLERSGRDVVGISDHLRRQGGIVEPTVDERLNLLKQGLLTNTDPISDELVDT